MFELEKTSEVQNLIQVTKSDSGISGPELAKAHIRLGELIAEHIESDPKDTTVVAVLRGGIFFAQGIYFKMGCRFDVFNPKENKIFVRPQTKNVILVDSVINSGKTLINLLGEGIIVASCVINERAVPLFSDRLYTVRVSQNSFIGGDLKKQDGNRGPDTTLRLFNVI